MLIITHTDEDLKLLMNCFSASCDKFVLTISLKMIVAMYQPADKVCISPSIYVNGQGWGYLFLPGSLNPKILPGLEKNSLKYF